MEWESEGVGRESELKRQRGNEEERGGEGEIEVKLRPSFSYWQLRPTSQEPLSASLAAKSPTLPVIETENHARQNSLATPPLAAVALHL